MYRVKLLCAACERVTRCESTPDICAYALKGSELSALITDRPLGAFDERQAHNVRCVAIFFARVRDFVFDFNYIRWNLERVQCTHRIFPHVTSAKRISIERIIIFIYYSERFFPRTGNIFYLFSNADVNKRQDGNVNARGDFRCEQKKKRQAHVAMCVQTEIAIHFPFLFTAKRVHCSPEPTSSHILIFIDFIFRKKKKENFLGKRDAVCGLCTRVEMKCIYYFSFVYMFLSFFSIFHTLTHSHHSDGTRPKQPRSE